MHLLSGPPATSPEAPTAADGGGRAVATLQHDIEALRRELDDVKAALKRVLEELGIDRG